MCEQWSEVPGVPNVLVSDLGRVKGPQGKVLKQTVHHKTKYHYVSVRKEGADRARPVGVHQLVMLGFRGLCPDGMEVNHIDRVKAHNRLGNLEYMTRQQNMAHSNRIGWHKGVKLSDDDARDIKRRRAAGETCTSIALKYDVSVGLISHICTGRARKHV